MALLPFHYISVSSPIRRCLPYLAATIAFFLPPIQCSQYPQPQFPQSLFQHTKLFLPPGRFLPQLPIWVNTRRSSISAILSSAYTMSPALNHLLLMLKLAISILSSICSAANDLPPLPNRAATHLLIADQYRFVSRHQPTVIDHGSVSRYVTCFNWLPPSACRSAALHHASVQVVEGSLDPILPLRG